MNSDGTNGASEWAEECARYVCMQLVLIALVVCSACNVSVHCILVDPWCTGVQRYSKWVQNQYVLSMAKWARTLITPRRQALHENQHLLQMQKMLAFPKSWMTQELYNSVCTFLYWPTNLMLKIMIWQPRVPFAFSLFLLIRKSRVENVGRMCTYKEVE